jgi:hydrogenase expression/formation protein HypD
MFRYRDRKLAQEILAKLRAMKLNLQIMHVCGTHQDTLTRYGLDSLLRDCGIRVRQGPGCPVCVTPAQEFEEAAVLAQAGKVITTFGDVSRVPGQNRSLLDLRSYGYDIRIVYSIADAVKLSRKLENDVVFMAVGFETTAPATATVLIEGVPKNFSILSCHRYVPPALHALLSMGEYRLDGLIEPGHVSTIIGTRPYQELSETYNLPQVIAGFEPLDLLIAVFMIAQQVQRGEAKVENEYSRVVKPLGNTKALQALDKVFHPIDVKWRGFSTIPQSGMALNKQYANWDARRIWADVLQEIRPIDEAPGCRCGEILRGLIEATDCPLFGTRCTPTHPIGPCMVSIEGSCQIEFKYGSMGTVT